MCLTYLLLRALHWVSKNPRKSRRLVLGPAGYPSLQGLLHTHALLVEVAVVAADALEELNLAP